MNEAVIRCGQSWLYHLNSDDMTFNLYCKNTVVNTHALKVKKLERSRVKSKRLVFLWRMNFLKIPDKSM